MALVNIIVNKETDDIAVSGAIKNLVIAPLRVKPHKEL